MKFDIVNPSDPYTMESPNLKLAAIAVCLLGEGKYALTGIDGTTENVPLFLFSDPDDWYTENFGDTFANVANAAIGNESLELAAVFDSVTLGRKKRSSMNDIGGRAKQYADAIRKRAESKAEA